jgi:4-hydroxy-tetrahydrodipicolinate synthase
MSSALSISGILTPLMVPLRADSEIHEDELRRYVDWLIEKGVHGLYPNGSTGEFTRFTAEERHRIIKIVCEQTGGRVPVLAGAAEANVRETIEACETYKNYGAQAVAIVSPFYYKLSQESIFAYYREIATNSPIDITLYNIPLFANPIEFETVLRLAECEKIIGIKDSSGDLAGMTRMIGAIHPKRPDFLFMTGWDAALVPMLMAGCQGGVHATSGIVPEITRSIYDLTTQKKFNEAFVLQKQLLELFDSVFDAADFPEGIRSAIDLRGFHFGKGRQPLSEKQTATLAIATEKTRMLIEQMLSIREAH